MAGRKRVIIENVAPELECGGYPIKRVAGEKVEVSADIFSDGHDVLRAAVVYKSEADRRWCEVPMSHVENDRWRGEFTMEFTGKYLYSIEGWVDHFQTWLKDIEKKFDAGQATDVDIMVGAGFVTEAADRAKGEVGHKLKTLSEEMLSGSEEKAVRVALGDELGDLMDRFHGRDFATRYGKELIVNVEPVKALFSAWYERFPRSCVPGGGRHGTLRDCIGILPEIARMGFDVFYLPPIHPIGKTNRKGRNNSPWASEGDVGSPWAIGSEDGGHKSIHPELGTIEDFRELAKKARDYGIDVAIDLAFQCSPDHPYVKEHPEWFRWRPDGTVQFAENPPKKYEDIIPLNFETKNWRELWEELKSVVLFWMETGVRIFRVDNPHTKPFPFWEWLIGEVKSGYPDAIFLSEAFTRPKVMYRLSKIGFTQAYTYFTWRNTKYELMEYLTELTRTDRREFFRPNFWPNTPDILPEHLQFGDRPAFVSRFVLAATLSSNYGIYGPAFELCVNESCGEREEYKDSEKYEIKEWDWDLPGNLKDLIARVNSIRKENPALQTTWNLKFCEVDNDLIIAYYKTTGDLSNIILVTVNLDPFHTQSGWVKVPVEELGIDPDQPYLVHDLIGDDKYIWQGERNYVEMNPAEVPAKILKIRKRLKREQDFDYFM